MEKKVLWVGIVSVAAVVLATAIWLITAKPAALRGAVINPPAPAAEIRLKDFDGQDFSLTSLRGKVVVLYFGYTNCPEECPLTMAHLKLAIDKLENDSRNVRVVMITTDPKRDNSGAMKNFLGKFSPDFIGLVGTPDELAPVWKNYGVTVEDSGETHSNFVYVIDPAGNFRETFLPDSEPTDMAADFGQLARGK
jgi:protein SCO1/2